MNYIPHHKIGIARTKLFVTLEKEFCRRAGFVLAQYTHPWI
jgi:hypothetical protein